MAHGVNALVVVVRHSIWDLPNKVRDVLGIMMDVNLLGKAPRETLEIVGPPYPNAISYRGEYFYRSGSTNQILRGAGLERLLLRTRPQIPVLAQLI